MTSERDGVERKGSGKKRARIEIKKVTGKREGKSLTDETDG